MDGLIAYALSKKYADEVGRSILDAGFKTQVEQDRSILQTAGQEKILYFIPKTTAESSDGYDEYVYSNNAWEQVGATDINFKCGVFDSFLIPWKTDNKQYNFMIIPKAFQHTGVYRIRKPNILCIPDIFAFDMGDTQVMYIYHFMSSRGGGDFIRMVMYESPNGLKMWMQKAELNGLTPGTEEAQIIKMTDWVDLTSTGGGTGIQSATTNSNGTMQFAMSDGSTVTSGGSNIVTSSNQQISMGYDNGGFYFLFDDGQEVVNNGTD